MNFDSLADYSYSPTYHQWQDLRMHYVDEGPADGPVMLLLHGMPTWSYLYRDMIPGLVRAGFRCIAPDHIGFGRSDKPAARSDYTYERHVAWMSAWLNGLDLKGVTLFCQDWGGLIGLRQVATMPRRFSRLVIMNTWLHHQGYEYTDAIRNWNRNWHEGGMFARPQPDVAWLLVLNSGLVERQVVFPAMLGTASPELSGRASDVYKGFAAPYAGLPDEGFNGYRSFPLSIPFDDFDRGNGAAQEHHYRTLLEWDKPVHFVWGAGDDIFPEAWGRAWAQAMGATFDGLPDAGHFLQDTHGEQIVEIIVGHCRPRR